MGTDIRVSRASAKGVGDYKGEYSLGLSHYPPPVKKLALKRAVIGLSSSNSS